MFLLESIGIICCVTGTIVPLQFVSATFCFSKANEALWALNMSIVDNEISK
jgi:hypothetical protein